MIYCLFGACLDAGRLAAASGRAFARCTDKLQTVSRILFYGCDLIFKVIFFDAQDLFGACRNAGVICAIFADISVYS